MTERIRVRRWASGHLVVTCIARKDGLSVEWSVKTFSTGLLAGIEEARAGARKALLGMETHLAESAAPTVAMPIR